MMTTSSSSSDKSKSLSWLAFVFSGYFSSSIGLIFFQRNNLRHIPYPLTIVICHLVLKFLAALLIRIAYEVKSGKSRILLPWSKYIFQLLIPGCTSGLDIGLSNFGLVLSTVSLYTMTKTTSIPFVLFFAILFKLEQKSCALIATILCIFMGLSLFSYKSTEFNLLGFSLLLTASALSGLRWTYIQKVMQNDVDCRNPIDMIYHIQPLMIITLTPFAFYLEGNMVASTIHGFRFHSFSEFSLTLFVVLFGGCLAFAMELFEYQVVYSSSSLSLSLLCVVKDITMVLLAVLFSGDEITVLKGIGMMICLLGILLHVARRKISSSSSKRKVRRNSYSSLLDDIPLLSDGDENGEESEYDFSGDPEFREMNDDFFFSDRRDWNGVKNSQLNSIGLIHKETCK